MQLAESNNELCNVKGVFGILSESDQQMHIQAKIGDTVYDCGAKTG